MRVFRMMLLVALAGCGGTPKALVPVDSAIKPWEPPAAEEEPEPEEENNPPESQP